MKPNSRAKNQPAAVSRVGSSALLACGHPSKPNNLVDGKCGTCLTASELEEIAKRNPGKIAEACNGLAKIFRDGNIVYDRKGKSLLEWEKFFNKKKQANDKSSRTPDL
jgi:hypothetical protein